MLSFTNPRSYEDDSASGAGADAKNYRVVVQASDRGLVSHLNWFKVTVTVTDEPESGMLAEWTIDPDGAGTVEDPGQSLLQFNAAAILTAGALTDGDGTPANIQWQWYRMSGRSGTGTAIANACHLKYVRSGGHAGESQ